MAHYVLSSVELQGENPSYFTVGVFTRKELAVQAIAHVRENYRNRFTKRFMPVYFSVEKVDLNVVDVFETDKDVRVNVNTLSERPYRIEPLEFYNLAGERVTYGAHDMDWQQINDDLFD